MLDDDLLREFQQIVIRWYPIARRSLLYYETEEGRRSTEAITEIRDVVDHFYQAATKTTPEEARHHLRLLEDHLRTAAVEPLEHAVEQRLVRVLRLRRRAGRWRRVMVWPLLGLRPPSAQFVLEKEEQVKAHIREGRSLKASIDTAQQAVDEFRSAHGLLVDIEGLYHGSEVGSRAYTLVVAVVVGVALMAATFWLGRVTSPAPSAPPGLTVNQPAAGSVSR